MNHKNIDLSFIIPAFNEEDNIKHTINSIVEYLPKGVSSEIIVVDHGSNDNTASIAENCGADVYTKSSGTVAGLRNYGANKAKGNVLVFIDADVHLTSRWRSNIPRVINKIKQGADLLTGSWVSVPENNTWLERYWFEPQQHKKNTHINSGHMIVGAAQFSRLGGFDERLETGEDYEISIRAKKMGFAVYEEHDLKVIHEGYPKTLFAFMKREFWHGKGDASSLNAFFCSKVALLSMFFLVLHIAVLLMAVFYFNSIMIAGPLLILLICLASSFQKFKAEKLSTIMIDALIYYFYFWSRSMSVIVVVAGGAHRKRQR